jgi:hypothetical protein
MGAACLLSMSSLMPMPARAAIVVTSSSLPAHAPLPAAGPAPHAVWQYALSFVPPTPATELQPAAAMRAGGGGGASGSFLYPGAVFGLGNFAGYVPGSCTSPAGWVCSARLPGLDPATAWAADVVDAEPADGVVDLVWTYVNGPKLRGSASGVPLGLFTASSWHGGAGMLDWSAQGGPFHTSSAAWANGGQVAGARASEVSEPASLALAGLALLLAAGTTPLAGPRRRCAQHRLR